MVDYRKYMIGYDELLKAVDGMGKFDAMYPPYNLKKTGDNSYVIELAVAGFGKQNINLTLEDGTLRIDGSVENDAPDNFLFRGISSKAFSRQFRLADTIEVKNADMINGMLRVWLENVIPESKKPKKIEITETEGVPSDQKRLG